MVLDFKVNRRLVVEMTINFFFVAANPMIICLLAVVLGIIGYILLIEKP